MPETLCDYCGCPFSSTSATQKRCDSCNNAVTSPKENNLIELHTIGSDKIARIDGHGSYIMAETEAEIKLKKRLDKIQKVIKNTLCHKCPERLRAVTQGVDCCLDFPVEDKE